MYKKIFITITFVLCLILSCGFINVSGDYVKKTGKIDDNMIITNKRACWISFIDMEEGLADLSKDDFIKQIGDMYDVIEANNLNTVIVHVRAFNDSIYPSELFPCATFISSDRKRPDYDPLEIMIELAHERNFYFEAWINPYRVSKDNKTTESYKTTEYYEKYKALMIEYINPSGENAIILDPALDETKKIVISGVEEVVKNYDVDAIHFDDYFYMDGMGEELTKEQKMKNVNSLISQVYEAIKKIDPQCEFGVSPAGNIENAKAQGVDVETWLSTPGYVDYIMPQIYWSDVFNTDDGIVTMYSDRCKQWIELNKIDLPIYVGLALYRVNEASSVDLGWSMQSDNLAKQYNIAIDEGYDGFALFRYRFLEKEDTITEREALLLNVKKKIRNNTTVDEVLEFGFHIINSKTNKK